MKFTADLHIHSKYSRATAKNLDFENVYTAAQIKGITVVGTGDFTHPCWMSEIKEKLEPAEEGLFRLKKSIAETCDKNVPKSCRGKVRFMLVTEISNIYKKKNKTRKNHNLVFMPDVEKAELLNSKLDKIGNIKSDGRPILGLDAKNLLELTLETSDQSFFIPAHIWTPWFSLLGSKSGYDSIRDCFEDLTDNIFAVETGLSSDPPMNWRVSGLDGLTLVSNSDAHSPLKIGREANIFNTDLSYSAIKETIKSGDKDKFLGTYEFYPEEGKYHLDGHRKCGIRLRPEQTFENNNICPKCGRPLTLGVLYRVQELADRIKGERTKKKHPFYSNISLTEILSEIFMVGPGSKKVMNHYYDLIKKLGPELRILQEIDIESIEQAGLPLIGEAIKRMRNNKVTLSPGFDGEFGKISIFNQEEIKKLLGQRSLFQIKKTVNENEKNRKIGGFKKKEQKETEEKNNINQDKKKFNKEQSRAIKHEKSPFIIIAGPGTGKTLTHRIFYLIKEKKVRKENILALTFTNKAAREMKERLEKLLLDVENINFVNTYHSLCYKILTNHAQFKTYSIIDEKDREKIIKDTLKRIDGKTFKQDRVLKKIIHAKQLLMGPGDNLDGLIEKDKQELFSKIYEIYQEQLSYYRLFDFEDLIFRTERLLHEETDLKEYYQNKYKQIFIDEYQDLNYGQYTLTKTLSPAHIQGGHICAIGDPNQSIYGFRGSNPSYFKRFVEDYPGADVISLKKNYRSTDIILNASFSQIKNNPVLIYPKEKNTTNSKVFSGIKSKEKIKIIESYSERAEAVAIGKIIEKLVGGVNLHSINSGAVDSSSQKKESSFSDFAVLFRTGAQSKIFEDVFDKAGIPYQAVIKKNVFERKGIPELISLLRIIGGSASVLDIEKIREVIAPGVGKKTLDKFKYWFIKNRIELKTVRYHVREFPIPDISRGCQSRLYNFLGKLYDLEKKTLKLKTKEKIMCLIENTRLKTILPNPEAIEALSVLKGIYEGSFKKTSQIFNTTPLQTDTDVYASGVEKVALMTIHAAKGLEFPVVFIAGCENNYLPLRKNQERKTDVDEERRLFYVAMTRAKERLYITYAGKRKIYGKTNNRELSPFITEIDAGLIEHRKLTRMPKKKKQIQLKLF